MWEEFLAVVLLPLRWTRRVGAKDFEARAVPPSERLSRLRSRAGWEALRCTRFWGGAFAGEDGELDLSESAPGPAPRSWMAMAGGGCVIVFPLRSLSFIVPISMLDNVAAVLVPGCATMFTSKIDLDISPFGSEFLKEYPLLDP